MDLKVTQSELIRVFRFEFHFYFSSSPISLAGAFE